MTPTHPIQRLDGLDALAVAPRAVACVSAGSGLRARRFPGQRALRILVRTAHIASAGIVLGAVTLGAEPGPWLASTMATGALLIADDLYRYGLHWLRFVQAWVILAKLALLAGAAHVSDAWPFAVWAAVIVGGVISHAPGVLRQRALWGPDGPCAVKSTGA